MGQQSGHTIASITAEIVRLSEHAVDGDQHVLRLLRPQEPEAKYRRFDSLVQDELDRMGLMPKLYMLSDRRRISSPFGTNSGWSEFNLLCTSDMQRDEYDRDLLPEYGAVLLAVVHVQNKTVTVSRLTLPEHLYEARRFGRENHRDSVKKRSRDFERDLLGYLASRVFRVSKNLDKPNYDLTLLREDEEYAVSFEGLVASMILLGLNPDEEIKNAIDQIMTEKK